MKEAVILAGGLGTRLRDVTGPTAKAMAPVNGKPFLLYLFQMMLKAEFDRVILATGFQSNSIENYFGYSFGTIAIWLVIIHRSRSSQRSGAMVTV